VTGVQRKPAFNTVASGTNCSSETTTLALGTTFASFRAMEGNPHGAAHISFSEGWIRSTWTAAKDPLFFLLHSNVDRLWAKWQWVNKAFDKAVSTHYDNSSTRIGHRLTDTMWPWNGVTEAPRPPTAPGGGLALSPCVSAPGATPVVSSMLDFQGRLATTSRLGFDYDDVPYP